VPDEKETKKRPKRMNQADKERRLDELTTKFRITNSGLVNNGQPHTGTDAEDMEEREWLKKDLGY
jgi:hypothetical protein